MVVSRILTPDEFGLYAMSIIGVLLLNIFAGFGLSFAIVREPEVNQEQLSTIFWVQLGGNVALFMIAIPLAFILDDFFSEPEVTHLFLLLSPLFLINGLVPVQDALFSREMDYKVFTYRTLFAETLAAAAAITAALLGAGIYSLILHALSAASLKAIFIWRISPWRPTSQFNWKSIENMWSFGKRMYLNQMIQSIFGQSRTLIFGRLFGADVLGHFNRASNLNVTVNQLSSGTYTQLAFSALSRINTNRESFLDAMKRGLTIKGALMVSAIGFFFIAGDAVILLMYGNQWVYAASLFPLLTISGMFGYLGSFIRASMEAFGRSDLTLKLQLMFSGSLIAAYAVAYFYGLEAMLYFTAALSVVKLFIGFSFASNAFGIPFRELFLDSAKLWLLPVGLMLMCRGAVIQFHFNPWLTAAVYLLFLILYFRRYYRDSVWNEVGQILAVFSEKTQRMMAGLRAKKRK